MSRPHPSSTLFPYTTLFRSGGVAVRGTPQQVQRLSPQAQAEVSQARQTYEQMRKTAAANDIVPEQYLYAVLQRSEEHTSELQSLRHLVCRLLLEKKKNKDK